MSEIDSDKELHRLADDGNPLTHADGVENVEMYRWSMLQARLAIWHQRKFGRNKPILDHVTLKVSEECGELAKAILRGDFMNAREEAADIAITLVHLMRGLGADLLDEMERKTGVIEKRLREKDSKR